MMIKEDLQKIRDELLRECPADDLGMPEYGCTCPPAEFDFRPLLMRLVGEIEAYRAEDERARKQLTDPVKFEGFSRRELVKIIMRYESDRNHVEGSLAVQYEALQAYEQITGMSPDRAKHFAECESCEMYGMDTSKCPQYREIAK